MGLPGRGGAARDSASRCSGTNRWFPAEYHSTWPCNFYQICENFVDPVHVSILHAETGFDSSRFHAMPTLQAVPTELGLRMITGRPGYERQSEFLFPTGIRIALPFLQPTLHLMFWVVPVNDTKTFSVHAWFMPLPEGMPP